MGAASRVRVVVAEDDEDIRAVVSIALDVDGRFDVVASAATASAAIHEVARCRPDAVLLDLMLPDVTPEHRLDVLAAVREVDPRSSVVVFTGLADDGLEERVLAAGASALVTKGAGSAAFIDALLCAPRVRSGEAVAVRNTFTGTWQHGFVMSSDDDRGYWLHRADGSALSAPVDHQRVRPSF